ncbi:protein kinase [Streptomyces sp. Ag109_G2-15]|uniref:serine/threonine-protein kinase n=1 Tax=Streptomyces sp. Ag109_G2-15 TaxID=1938850 RepID=UPI000BDAE5CB|nr:serine/threonine-protein kinase [Streptomyces sp. Ag109_G2-15]SOD82698.1 PQQ-like domain-containing protein [Streptomyces sp. Ag109_G2-15]
MKPLGTGDPIRLGPYRLLGVLGEGGMGKVYLGQDGAGAIAAIKVLRPELAHDANLAQRFVREALAAQAVRSPGVAAVLGAQTEGGRPWIATEFLAGPTLDQAVDKHGPLDETGVRALAASIAQTLADIHAVGFIHRDLKPQNIVLTSTGPRVIDFGIARPEHGLTLTTTGQIPVTPGYGAPEQVLGRRVTPAADVFSLGAVLVYAATGRRAFEGAHVAAVQYEVVHGEPRWDGLPPQLHTLVAPCLAKDGASRPAPGQIATAFAPPKNSGRVWQRGPVGDEIKERERQVRQFTAPPTTGSSTTVTRRRLLTGLAAGGTVLAAGGGTTGWWLLRQQARRDKKDGLFDIPPAVTTPKARLLLADDGDYIVGGSPKPLWSRHEIVDKDSAAPLPVRDVVVVGDYGNGERGIAAYNVVDGKLRWAARDVQPDHYLSLSDRLIVAVDAEGTLHTFVPSTGERKWTADAEAAVVVAADDKAVYVMTKDHRLRSVGRSDAKVRWTARIPSEYRGKISPRVVVGLGRLVLPTVDGHVLTVATGDGRPAWQRRNQAKEISINPVVRDGVVYLNGRTLTALRLADGHKIWSSTTTDMYDAPAEWGPVSVHGDSVYAVGGTFPERRALTDGSSTWTSRLDGSSDSPVLIQGTGVWTIDHSYKTEVNAVNVSNGYPGWTYKLPEAEHHAIVVAGNRAFIRNDSSLYALPVF